MEAKAFCSEIDNTLAISFEAVSKIYNTLRNKIMNKMHLFWKNNPLGEEVNSNGYCSVEIDESSIIGNQNIVIWMFGIVERISKNARIFCVLNDRTQQNLLNLVRNNVITEDNNLDDEMEESESESIKTRVYSDCFASYNEQRFAEYGYILKRVNHSIWFGYGSFHTNTIEGLWSQIKGLCDNFSGLSIFNLDKKFSSDKQKKIYLDGWICYALLLREFERKKLNWKKRVELLCQYLSI